MRTRSTLPAVVIALFLATGSIWAHHNLAVEFDKEKPVTLRGTLTRVDWVNPHPWVYLDVKGADGRVENWAVETGSTSRLLDAGLKKTDFQYGTAVVVVGFAARSGARRAGGWTITFPDREASVPAQRASFLLGR